MFIHLRDFSILDVKLLIYDTSLVIYCCLILQFQLDVKILWFEFDVIPNYLKFLNRILKYIAPILNRNLAKSQIPTHFTNKLFNASCIARK
jgi:hypothetical protein